MSSGRESHPQAVALLEDAWDLWEQALEARDEFLEEEAAEEAFQQSIEGFTAALAIGLNDEDAAYAYALRGYAYFQREELERAIEDLNRALELDPEFALALWYRGQVHHYGREDLARATADYQRAIALYEEDPDLTDIEDPVALYLDHAEALRDLGQVREALKSAQRATEIEPRHAEALYLRAALEARLGDLEAAAKHLGRALRLEPDLRTEAQDDPELAPLRADPELWQQALTPPRRGRRAGRH